MKADRGYVIPAINTGTVDYERCAHQLAASIRAWHPDADITIITAQDLPHGDRGGQQNDWQMFSASPYHETIKLEADMLLSGPIDHWWYLFRSRDMVISQGARDIYDRVTHQRYYRRSFDQNHLPDVYNAITYWRVSHTAHEFARTVRMIFENWNLYRTLLRFPDHEASTDMVYAMAAVIVGVEKVTLPADLDQPRIVHMKRHIIGTQGSDWSREMIWEWHDSILRINTVAQHGLVHYNIKTWNPHEQQRNLP